LKAQSIPRNGSLFSKEAILPMESAPGLRFPISPSSRLGMRNSVSIALRLLRPVANMKKAERNALCVGICGFRLESVSPGKYEPKSKILTMYRQKRDIMTAPGFPSRPFSQENAPSHPVKPRPAAA
jgi:hypothetical protein